MSSATTRPHAIHAPHAYPHMHTIYPTHLYRQSTYALSTSSIATSAWTAIPWSCPPPSVPADVLSEVPSRQTSSTFKSIRKTVARPFRLLTKPSRGQLQESKNQSVQSQTPINALPPPPSCPLPPLPVHTRSHPQSQLQDARFPQRVPRTSIPPRSASNNQYEAVDAVDPDSSGSSLDADQSLSSTSSTQVDSSFSSDASLLPSMGSAELAEKAWKEHIMSLVAESLTARTEDVQSNLWDQIPTYDLGGHGTARQQMHQSNILGNVMSKPLPIGEAPTSGLSTSATAPVATNAPLQPWLRRSFLPSLKSLRDDLPVMVPGVAAPARDTLRSSWAAPPIIRRASSMTALQTSPRPLSVSNVPNINVHVDAELDTFLNLDLSEPTVRLVTVNPGISFIANAQHTCENNESSDAKPSVPAKSAAVRALRRAPLQPLPLQSRTNATMEKPLPPPPAHFEPLLALSSPNSIGLGLCELRSGASTPTSPAVKVNTASRNSPTSSSPKLPKSRTVSAGVLAARAQAALALDLSDPGGLSLETLETMLTELHELSEEMRAVRARALARSIMTGTPSPITAVSTPPPTPLRPVASEVSLYDASALAHVKEPSYAPRTVSEHSKENAGSRIPVRKSLWGSVTRRGRSLSPRPSTPRSPRTYSLPPQCRIIVTSPEEEGLIDWEWNEHDI
jgi:hypothetical protein